MLSGTLATMSWPLRKFVCSREGFCEAKHMKRENKQWRPRNITRVGCRAKFVIALQRNTGVVVCEELSCLLRSH